MNIEEKETLIRGEGSVGLVAGLDNMKGITGSKWSEWSEDEKAKMKEVTGEILVSQVDEFYVDLDGEKAVKISGVDRTK